MRRELITWELKKLLSMPMFAVFLALCIAFNALLVFESHSRGSYMSYVAEVTEDVGGQMGTAFDERLEQTSPTEFKDILIAQTRGAEDILENFDTGEVAAFIQQMYEITGPAADNMDRNFERLQQSVDRLAQEDASLSLAAAGMTEPLLDTLLNKLCRAIITEGMLMAMLLALYAHGYEGLSRTEAAVYSSKTGRTIQKHKLAASAIASLMAYGLLCTVSVGLFALVWRLGPIWGANMSSQFHYVSIVAAVVPFLSWVSFSIAGYLAATLLLGAVVVLVFHLLGFAAGLLSSNAYYGFLLCILFVALSFTVMMVSGDQRLWLVYQLAQWTPVFLWWGQGLWFTGLEIGAVLPFQECWSALFCLISLGLVTLGLYRRFTKKDVKELAV